MPLSRPARSHNKDEIDQFAAINKIDPNLHAVQPPEPYGLLLPGIEIQEGDMKRPVGEGYGWTLAEESEWGYKAPGQGIAYARVTVPEQYRLALGDEKVSCTDLIWTSQSTEWLMLAQDQSIIDSWDTIREIQTANRVEKNILVFFAKRNADVADHQTVSHPTRHRDLWPGEKLKRGDMIIYQGLPTWQKIAEAARGQSVPDPGPENGSVRYCRAVAPNHAAWYVSEKGNEKNLGGVLDPWPSLEFAMKKIEKDAKAAGVAPYGTIWDLATSKPVQFYDLPEPAYDEPASDEPVTEEHVAEVYDREAAAATVDETPMIEVEIIRQDPPRDAQWEPDTVIVADPAAPAASNQVAVQTVRLYDLAELQEIMHCNSDQVIIDAKRQLPRGFRMMEGHEELAHGDMIFQPLSGLAGIVVWQLVPPQLYGAAVCSLEYMFARRTISAMDAFKQELMRKVVDAEQQVTNLTKLLDEMKLALRIGH